jgi:hypothetical protein
MATQEWHENVRQPQCLKGLPRDRLFSSDQATLLACAQQIFGRQESGPIPTIMSSSKAYLLVAPVLIGVVVWFSFQNSLDNAFVFDDHLAITNNNDVKDPTTHRIWTNDIWGKELSAHDSHKSFRPLLMMLFRKLWSISSEARWFREVSVGAHFIATLLLFQLTSTIWNNKKIGFATALIFAAHPIHVESVSAVVNMAEAFSAILIMASYIIFLRQTATPAVPRNALATAATTCISAVVWVALVIVAALFKETGITACLLVIGKTVMDAVLGGIAAVRKPRTHTTAQEKAQPRPIALGAYFVFFVTAVVLLYVYMAGRTLMTSPHRAEILSDPQAILYNLLLKPIAERQRESYLDSSQLLRRAENPFAQLQGLEKTLSTMVRSTHVTPAYSCSFRFLFHCAVLGGVYICCIVIISYLL